VFWEGAQNVFVTRLHVRYDRARFPEDLVFQATQDRTNFQGRYIMQHPFTGAMSCPAADDYRRSVRARQEQEAKQLADLTGWQLSDIKKRMKLDEAGGGDKKWYERIWR
jgi:hypothetical protein